MTNFNEDDEKDYDAEENGSHSSLVWMLKGITQSVPGNLALENDRLILTVEGVRVFNVSVGELQDVVFPWYCFSGGMKFRIGADKYRLSFVAPDGTYGPGVAEGRRTGKLWMFLLK